ncbi:MULTISPECIES: hypothetical protein [Acidianus]|uniref:Uncharacterized protein n=1 Tax=Candidatus Acidianus copahuensis TaxID=1160895 RepID=A0A031LL24_9CREN|nr:MULTISPECIES: hypothetical protein [Acidianus]EZQ01603.1 hypothetical protein CM19_12795 [Candidatus Acidianus copahuensis]NON61569.1 hypothetical protein [Acidianus sp. RZ1]
MKVLIGFIPFFGTPDGQVIEKVYDIWKEKEKVVDLETDPIDAAEIVKNFKPENVLLVGSSRYVPEGITEKEFVLESKDPWEMLELIRPGLDGRYYVEDIAYGILIFAGYPVVHALYYKGNYSDNAIETLSRKVEEKRNWLSR